MHKKHASLFDETLHIGARKIQKMPWWVGLGNFDTQLTRYLADLARAGWLQGIFEFCRSSVTG